MLSIAVYRKWSVLSEENPLACEYWVVHIAFYSCLVVADLILRFESVLLYFVDGKSGCFFYMKLTSYYNFGSHFYKLANKVGSWPLRDQHIKQQFSFEYIYN